MDEPESQDGANDNSPLKGDAVPFAQFLEEFPNNTPQKVTGYFKNGKTPSFDNSEKLTPQLRLWCKDEQCDGYRRFDGRWHNPRSIGGAKGASRDFLVYRCRDCGKVEKTYCILSMVVEDDDVGIALKIGEFPELHISLPPSLPNLLGPDYPILIKGLKAEKQGLGMGAFAYYRRVVENQKGRLFEKIADVAVRLNAPPEAIEALRKAAKEDQFSRAVDSVKDFIPASLLADGHNPMKLLHKALSMGIHARDDAECLRIAHSIRMVLQDLAARIKEALREEREVKTAISELLKFTAGN